MSDDPEVLEVYASYGKSLKVIRHSLFFNDVVSREKFPVLFDYLSTSSKYHIVLDTDEFLTVYERETGFDKKNVVRFLDSHSEIPVIPTLWAQSSYNGKEHDTFSYHQEELRFHFDPNFLRFVAGGKPIILSSHHPGNYVMHLVQVARNDIQSASLSLVIFHLKHHSLARRIKTNLLKLQARNHLKSDDIYSESKNLYENRNQFEGPALGNIEELYLYHHNMPELVRRSSTSSNFFDFNIAKTGFPTYDSRLKVTLGDFLDKYYSSQELQEIIFEKNE